MGWAVKYDCYKAVSENTGKTTICQDIAETAIKNDCYFTQAVVENDETLCESISVQSEANRCKNTVRGYV